MYIFNIQIFFFFFVPFETTNPSLGNLASIIYFFSKGKKRMVGFGGVVGFICPMLKKWESRKKERKRVYRKVPPFCVWVPKQQIFPCEEPIMHNCLICDSCECICH